MVAGDVHRDAVQAAAGGDVKHVGFRAGAEAAVGRQCRGRDTGQFPAGGGVHHDAESARRAHGGVDVSLHVNRHAVDAGFVAEIDEYFFRPEAAVAADRECVQCHAPAGSVVVLGDVKCIAVRRQGEAVGLLDLFRADGELHGAVRRVVPVNGHLVLFLNFVADIAWVAEINLPVRQDHEVVGREVASAVEFAGEHFQFSVGKDFAKRHEAVVRPAAGDQPAGSVEHQPVALAGGGTVDSRFAGLGIEFVNLAGGAFAAWDVAEIHRTVGSDGDAFGEFAFVPKFLKPRTRRQDGRAAAWLGRLSLGQARRGGNRQQKTNNKTNRHAEKLTGQTRRGKPAACVTLAWAPASARRKNRRRRCSRGRRRCTVGACRPAPSRGAWASAWRCSCGRSG